jgi:hypothetical protein
MSIYYPALDQDKNGRIPLYVKIIPRGDISTASSEISSLELLSVCFKLIIALKWLQDAANIYHFGVFCSFTN